MNEQFFDFGIQRRPEFFVGRTKQLARIRQILGRAQEDNRTVVIAIRAPGGLGKTRLLEEVLMRLGHPYVHERLGLKAPGHQKSESWSFAAVQYVPSDVLDFAWPDLSARSYLLEALLHRSLQWAKAERNVSFSMYEQAVRELQRALVEQRDIATLQRLEREVEKRFQDDLKYMAQSKIRPVWAWDTVERLAVVLDSPLWQELAQARGQPLVSYEDASFITAAWFITRLQKNFFGPAVFLLAGRDREGEILWKTLRQTYEKSGKAFQLEFVNLEAFEPEETRQFLIQVRDALPTNDHQHLADFLSTILEEEAHWRALHRLSQGQPVRLAMYVDVLATADTVPVPWLQIVERLSHLEVEEEDAPSILEPFQKQFEKAFLDLLFRREAEQPSLEAQALLALARSPRGLSSCQMHFLLDAPEKMKLSEWYPNLRELEELTEVYQNLLRWTIIKVREAPAMASGQEHNGNGRCPEKHHRWRLALQDELYRIIAQHLAADENVQIVEAEKQARRRQYAKLRRWAEGKKQQLHQKRRKMFRKELQQWQIDEPVQALRPRFRSMEQEEERRRWIIERQIQFWEIEILHYWLLLNPAEAWNSRYVDVAETRWYANSLEGELLLQQEVRTLLEQWGDLLVFAEWPTPYDKDIQESLRRLRAAVRTEDAARWIKRWIAQREFWRAIDLATKIEAAIAKLSEEERREMQWSDPLNWGERRLWQIYAEILIGQATQKRIEFLKLVVDLLTKLLVTSPDQEVYTPDRVREEPGGNLLPPSVKGAEGMPMAPRLQRIVAIGYNRLGYGYVVLGSFAQGSKFYRRSLKYMRDIDFPAQQAATLNNLGRALANMGRPEEGLMLVYRALALREELAAIVPYAYSLNTTASINNELGRTIRALGQAASAAAMFRRANDPRGLGLALIEVSIASRHLAKAVDPGLQQTFVGAPEGLLDVAKEAALRARDIFRLEHCQTSSPQEQEGVCEPLRLVESLRVLGEVYQDSMPLADSPSDLRRWYLESLAVLREAEGMARERGWGKLAAAAVVDQVETHYWYAYHLRRLASTSRSDKDQHYLAQIRSQIENAIQVGLELIQTLVPSPFAHASIPSEAEIREREKRTEKSDDLSTRKQKDRPGYPTFVPPKREPEFAASWNLLAKRYRFESGLLLERVWLCLAFSDETDHELTCRRLLDKAARALVKAVLYGRIFSPQAQAIQKAFRFADRYIDEFL